MLAHVTFMSCSIRMDIAYASSNYILTEKLSLITYMYEVESYYVAI